MVDKCLYHLSIINNILDPRSQKNYAELMKLRGSVNVRQSCMSLICQIWNNNNMIFRLSLNKFVAHFVKLFKPDDEEEVLNTLMFDYIEYS